MASQETSLLSQWLLWGNCSKNILGQSTFEAASTGCAEDMNCVLSQIVITYTYMFVAPIYVHMFNKDDHKLSFVCVYNLGIACHAMQV